jgi:Ca2+-binding RTX toxin-like protein
MTLSVLPVLAVIFGTVGPDDLTGTSKADTIQTGPQSAPSDDTGADTVQGGGGNDVIVTFFGADIANGQGGDDSIDGGYGNDTLSGDGGGDDLIGGLGNDLLVGDATKVTFLNVGGLDVLDGGDGDDTLLGGSFADDLTGGPGNDKLYGGTSRDILRGGDGDDYLDGGGGRDDILRGDAGNDTVIGSVGIGANTSGLDGGTGIDVLTGAGTLAQPTRFAFRSFNGSNQGGFGTGTNRTTITNFAKGVDELNFVGVHFTDHTPVTNPDTNGDGIVNSADKGWSFVGATKGSYLRFVGWNSELRLNGISSLIPADNEIIVN